MSCATLKRHLDSDLFSPTSRPAAKRRRLAVRGLFGIGTTSPTSASASVPSSKDGSPFSSSVSSRLSPGEMQVRLRHEIRQLRRLKQLQFGLDKDDHNNSSSSTSSPRFNSSSAIGGSSSVDNFGDKSGAGMSKDSALFTFKQVGLICERMLQEKEEALRREYEQVLSTKLAEQYDTFVKFTHDQIQKSFSTSAPSYLS